MAILAVLEVEDDGSLKIKDFASLVRSLGADVSKSNEDMARSSQQAVKAHQQHVTAIQQLVKQARDAYAQTQQNAQAFSILTQQLRTGTTATDVHVKAIAELAKATANNATFQQKYGAELTALTGKIRAGTVVDAEFAKSLQNVAQGYMGAGQGAQAFSLQAAALAGSLSLLAAGAYGLLRESGDLAARIQTLGVVMDIAAKNTKVNSAEMRIQVESIKGLGITTKEATDAVLQFANSNLKLSGASKLARVAQDLAVIAGENSSQTFQRLTAAVQTTNTMLLRQVGITTGLDAVMDKHAATMGKNSQALSASERQQAMLNFILEEGAKRAGAYEASMGTAAKQISSFTRYVEESKVALGNALVPTMGVVIVTLTEMLKVWMALPPPIQAVTTYLLAAASAATVFSAALAGAKFLGILSMFQSLGSAVGLFTVGLRAGMGIWASAMGAFGPWGIALGALIAVVGLATGGWVAYNNAVADNTQILQTNLAKAIQQQESFGKLSKSALALTAEFESLRSRGIEPSVLQQEKYREVAEKLLAISPRMVEVISAEGRVYRILAEEVRNATAAKDEQVQVDLKILRTKVSSAQADVKRAEEQLREAQALAGRIARGEETRWGSPNRTGAETGRVEDRLTTATKEIEGLQARLKLLKPIADTAFTALQEGFSRAGSAAEQQRMGMQKSNEVLREYTIGLADAGKKSDTLASRMRIAGKSQADFAKAFEKGPQDMKAFLDQIDQAMVKHTAVALAEGKKQEAARKSTYEKIAGITTQEKGAYAGLSQALNEVGLSQQEYNRRLADAAPMLANFSKSQAQTQEDFKGLAVHAKALESLKTYEVFKQWADAGDAVTRSFAQSGAEMLRVFNLAGSDAAREFAKFGTEQRIAFDATAFSRLKGYSKELRDTEVAQAQDARQIRESLYEQLVVSKMKEVDQALYAESKRLAGVIRSAELEKKARNDALKAEREAVLTLLKVQLDALEARRVAEEEAATLRVQRTLEDRARAVSEALFNFDLKVKVLRAENDLDSKMQAADKNRADLAAQTRAAALQKELADMLTGQRLLLTAAATDQKTQRDAEAKAQADRLRGHAANAVAVVEIDAKRVAAQNALTDRLTAEQTAASAKASAKIINDYRVMKDFAINAAQEIASGFVSGFLQAITGAKTFKDELIGVMESLKRSIYKILDDILQKAIDNAFAAMRAQATGGVRVDGLSPYASLASAGYVAANGQTLRPGDAGYGVLAPQARGATGWRSGSGFAQSGWGGAVAGAGVGWMAGSIVGRYADGSYARGALGGAAAGAGAGFVVGGVPGAVVGAVAGGISGWWQARKQRKQVIADRAEIVEEMGGMAEFKKLATEAGFAYEKFLNTKKPSEFGKEVLALKKALEELDLKKAQKSLEDFYGGVDRLREKALAAGLGTDYGTAFGAREAANLTRAEAAGLGVEYEKAVRASTVPVSAEDARKALDVLAAKLGFIEAHGGLEKLKAKAEAAGVSLDEMLNAKTIDEATAAIERLDRALQLQEVRQAFIAINGGLEVLKAKALAAGVSIDDLLNAKTIEEAQRAIEELSKALQLQELKQGFIDTYGSIERLTEAARAAGIDISKLLNAKTLEEATAAAKELAKALELKKAKDSLYDVVSQLKDMQRLAKLLGFDLDRILNATTIEGMRQAQEEFNRLVAVFKAEVSALESAAAALNARAEAFQATVDRLTRGAFESLDEDQMERLAELYEEATKAGYLGSILAFARENAEALGLTEAQLLKLRGVTEAVRREFDILGRETAGIFLAMVRKTGDWVGAMEAIGPALDILKANADALGITLDGFIGRLVGLRNTMQQNIDVTSALSAINQMIDGLVDAKALTQDLFSALADDAVEQFNKLEGRGVALDETLLMLQPTLQRLWEAQRDFNFQLTESQQNLLNLAIANGMVGQQFTSTESKMLDVLILIARVLGADIPEALDRTAGAAERSGARQEGAMRRVGELHTETLDAMTEEETKLFKARNLLKVDALRWAGWLEVTTQALPSDFKKETLGADAVRQHRENTDIIYGISEAARVVELLAVAAFAAEQQTIFQTTTVAPHEAFLQWMNTTGIELWQGHFAAIDQELASNLGNWRTWKTEIIGLMRDIRTEWSGNPWTGGGPGGTTYTGPTPPPPPGPTTVVYNTTVAPTLSVNALDRANFDDAADEITDRLMDQLGTNQGQRAVQVARAVRPYQT